MVKIREDMTGWNMWEHGVPDSRLIVVEQVEDYIGSHQIHHAQYLCECSCGSDKNIIARASDIKCGNIKSCGCLRTERIHDINKKYNPVELNLFDEYGNYGIGYCYNTNNKFYFDMEDYEIIKDYCWSEHIRPNNGYHTLIAYNPYTKKTIRMSDLLGYKWCDHIDRNPLNNRKYNFRSASIQENNRNISIRKDNSSGVIGVGWNKTHNKWRARINVNKKEVCLGWFMNKDDAIVARLNAEIKYFGEFAPQKHLFEQYGVEAYE